MTSVVLANWYIPSYTEILCALETTSCMAVTEKGVT
jgi:hypothetical protein